MKYCPNCGKEISDDIHFCPYCGTKINDTKDNLNTTPTPPKYPEEKKNTNNFFKIVVVALIVSIICVAGLIGYKGYQNEKLKQEQEALNTETYNKFANLYNTILHGAIDTEDANILVLNVWYNSIHEVKDETTDKYTRQNNGTGKFYDDFNDALDNLYADEEFLDTLKEIYEYQEEAKKLLKDLQNHPQEFNDEYYDFKEAYNTFVEFTNMPLKCEGSYNSYIEKHNELDDEVVKLLTSLDIYFDD